MSIFHRAPREITSELFRSCSAEEVGSPKSAAYKAAYYLFRELVKSVGLDHARLMFLHFANGPSARQLQQFEKQSLRYRLKTMKGGPNVEQLAREIAKENEAFNRALPPERNGEARPTNQMSIAKHIRRARDQRKSRRTAQASSKKKRPQKRQQSANDARAKDKIAHH